MGDCGAFTYVREEAPPYTVDEVIDFYEDCGFDAGLSLDHVILGFELDAAARATDLLPPQWGATPRADARTGRGVPSPASRAELRASSRSASRRAGAPSRTPTRSRALQRLGYERIALGGLVAQKTHEILAVLGSDRRGPRRRRPGCTCSASRAREQIPAFATLRRDELRQHVAVPPGVQGRPRQLLRRSTDAWIALRVPQVEGNAKLQRRIRAGEIDRPAGASTRAARARNARRIRSRRGDGRRRRSPRCASTRSSTTRRATAAGSTARCSRPQPWKHCDCAVCRDAGIQVIIFRGTERNKRRGFHNLHVFANASALEPESSTTAGAP